jgi:hypothetical protein
LLIQAAWKSSHCSVLLQEEGNAHTNNLLQLHGASWTVKHASSTSLFHMFSNLTVSLAEHNILTAAKSQQVHLK